jgi:hypothetical protein
MGGVSTFGGNTRRLALLCSRCAATHCIAPPPNTHRTVPSEDRSRVATTFRCFPLHSDAASWQ